MSLLSRAFGVQPHSRYVVRIQRDLVIPASDGVPLLANRFYPVDIDRPPLVLLRSPYCRGVALVRMPQLLAERGYQVLYLSLRGTDDSGGEFDGFTIDPADADGTLSWLREQPWFGGVLATWCASYLGFAQWELAARVIPEWKIAVIQDAPGVRPSVYVSRRRIRARQRAGLGADRRSHVSCTRYRRRAVRGGAGIRNRLAPLDRPARLAPAARDTAWYLHPPGRLDRHPASAGPPSWFRYDPADATPSNAGTAVALSAGPSTTTASKPDLMFLPSPATPKPPILR